MFCARTNALQHAWYTEGAGAAVHRTSQEPRAGHPRRTFHASGRIAGTRGQHIRRAPPAATGAGKAPGTAAHPAHTRSGLACISAGHGQGGQAAIPGRGNAEHMKPWCISRFRVKQAGRRARAPHGGVSARVGRARSNLDHSLERNRTRTTPYSDARQVAAFEQTARRRVLRFASAITRFVWAGFCPPALAGVMPPPPSKEPGDR